MTASTTRLFVGESTQRHMILPHLWLLMRLPYTLLPLLLLLLLPLTRSRRYCTSPSSLHLLWLLLCCTSLLRSLRRREVLLPLTQITPNGSSICIVLSLACPTHNLQMRLILSVYMCTGIACSASSHHSSLSPSLMEDDDRRDREGKRE